MRKIFIFLAVVSITGGAIFAEEGVLIDFSELLDDYQGQHQATLWDYSSIAGTRFSEEQKAEMNTSLYVPNWDVTLSSSSKTVTTESFSYALPATVLDNSPQFAGEQVMAVRVHYPTGTFNSYAWVKPPFEIPMYATSDLTENAPRGEQFVGFGVLQNVGAIRDIRMNVHGMNFPMAVAVVLRNENQETQQYPLGHLEFSGWRELSWVNPNYIADVRHREVRRYPLYPRNVPSVALDSIQFYRDAEQEGGDFIVYMKDIVVTYDQAILQGFDTDLDHEQIWGIIKEREEERRRAELLRLGDKQVLYYIEEQKRHKDAEETPPAQ